jgi:hypothetical protein
MKEAEIDQMFSTYEGDWKLINILIGKCEWDNNIKMEH